jgi:hypothetical protein
MIALLRFRAVQLIVTRFRGARCPSSIRSTTSADWSGPGDEASWQTRISSSINLTLPPVERVQQLALLSSSMDSEVASKFAIVAPQDVAFGLGRMYETYRGMEQRSTKKVGVFRSLGEALAFLGTERVTPPSGDTPNPERKLTSPE